MFHSVLLFLFLGIRFFSHTIQHHHSFPTSFIPAPLTPSPLFPRWHSSSMKQEDTIRQGKRPPIEAGQGNLTGGMSPNSRVENHRNIHCHYKPIWDLLNWLHGLCSSALSPSSLTPTVFRLPSHCGASLSLRGKTGWRPPILTLFLCIMSGCGSLHLPHLLLEETSFITSGQGTNL